MAYPGAPWQVLGLAVRTENMEQPCSSAVRSGDKRLCTLTTCTVGKGQAEAWRRPWPGWHGHGRLALKEWLYLSLEVPVDKEHLLWCNRFLWGKHGSVYGGAEMTMGHTEVLGPVGLMKEKARCCSVGYIHGKELLNHMESSNGSFLPPSCPWS